MELLQVELAQTNPDIETLKLTLWVAAGVIMVLFGLVMYFIKNARSSTEKSVEKLNDIVNSVIEVTNDLKIVVEVIKNRQIDEKTFLKEKNQIIEKRLNEHAGRLDCHDKKITRIETTVGISEKL